MYLKQLVLYLKSYETNLLKKFKYFLFLNITKYNISYLSLPDHLLWKIYIISFLDIETIILNFQLRIP